VALFWFEAVTTTSNNTMGPSNIKRIQEVAKKEWEWATDKLVFNIAGDPSFFGAIPYLGMGPKLNEMLYIFNPKNLTLVQIIENFKVQAIEQGGPVEVY
jgi:hypothetical protein